MIKRRDRKELRRKRHLRVRSKIKGTPERPRLAVYRSERHIYAQIIDDIAGRTIVSASTVDKELREKLTKTWNQEAAKEVGKLIAKRAAEKGIKKIVFDRGGFKFHGRIKSLADAAREAGLEF
ncbi:MULTISPECIES: 50S ribosomal protein L18 [Kosmotoga]|uniref:Large ribosomal subunit protein uL18 n=1 Tax=Kosmotoga olearia (strain ATCC BAA-1733 / DSM 21960 / TBF 19.5.1) TaxID=521045 RepID=RL18_KOSOT|nr:MULTISPECIES: 50S ribosomal protein L18 [Kosmotoga]C5CGI6.1 RecName: Full=Large ribosomal subunit protein uL18; AltName: Full=50S ribosomal protein L18 [Kosmotoga olearia TBF 19.5.1]ACR80567.1 ribosomal protein L18 [Kosmotoga olearia TBF 19.5.1]MDI3523302.1 large subunit ribosomal protein [Kosmotoga sp.]MDK2952768.1 large subunit ribosomal protein [Kosmotoga sp.]OAA19435.1 50S ribosomal protein L18 [Kosmotoga sp. DU53]